MALATQTDVEQRLQIDFTSGADPVCATLIAAAQAHIEREVGYPLETAASLVEKFDGDWSMSTLYLSRRPLTAVASIVEAGVTLAATDYMIYSDGRIMRLVGGYETAWRTSKPQAIVVTYTAGYAAGLPKDLNDVCAWSAARAFQVGAAFAAMPVDAFIQSISLADSDSITYRDVASTLTGYVSLTDQDLAACKSYRLPAVV